MALAIGRDAATLQHRNDKTTKRSHALHRLCLDFMFSSQSVVQRLFMVCNNTEKLNTLNIVKYFVKLEKIRA